MAVLPVFYKPEILCKYPCDSWNAPKKRDIVKAIELGKRDEDKQNESERESESERKRTKKKRVIKRITNFTDFEPCFLFYYFIFSFT